MSTSQSPLERLRSFCHFLTFKERKALITLARSQSVPERDSSPILFDKVSPILDRLTPYPPFENLAQPLSDDGRLVIRLLSSSLTTGLLIVYALGVTLSDDEVQRGCIESFTKEFSATQTRRLPSSWNWSALFYLTPKESEEVIHPLFPARTATQRLFAENLVHFEGRLRGSVILPHYSTRGISSETATLLLNRVRSARVSKTFCGSRTTFHRKLNRLNVTSRDVVHHFVRTGEWVPGHTQMKQRWYPSGLLPRTYFSWGGFAIALSTYLRNFFNNLGDCFPPTHRHNRVQPDWLQMPERRDDGGFMFYDLTSFTSWFHEHEPFLRAVSDRFRAVTVYLCGYDLTLAEHNLGDLLDAYVSELNDLPEFIVHGNIKGAEGLDEHTFRHLCAGFLGIPGNLITCTIAHGLAQASLVSHERELQVPGDDVGTGFRSAYHADDKGVCAKTLGVLQFDKVFSTQKGISIYLKRLVVDLGRSITLSPMLIFPLLPYLINPTGSYRSNQFRLPPPDDLRPRAAKVMVAFCRDVWKSTKGVIDKDTHEILLLFLRHMHDMVGLPYGAIFQGRLYGDDPESEAGGYPGITVKFSVEDDDCLYSNPDAVFASKHITRMTIRATNEVELTPPFDSLRAGETIIVNRARSWSFLEDMGYVRVVGIPGEKIELIGPDARKAYLFASEPPLREVEILEPLRTDQLVAAGVLKSGGGLAYEGKDESGSRHVDMNTRSWRYRRYVDLDDPKGAGLYGRSKDFVDDKLASTRFSLSPEPIDISELY